MLINLFKCRLLLLVSTFFLCQCNKEVSSLDPVMPLAKPVTHKLENPYKISAAAYLAKANNQEGSEKQHLLLAAAGNMFLESHWRQGLTILAQTANLTAAQMNEKNLLLAKVDLVRDKPQKALAKLTHINGVTDLSLYHQIQFHELRAQSYRLTANPLESVIERITLESLLGEEKSQLNNTRLLWLTLINAPVTELNARAEQVSENPVLHGWLQLADISRQYHDNVKSLLAALYQWQSQYPAHPANKILPSPLDSIVHKMIERPKQVALLIPLSGALSGPGNAIREGFLAAYKAYNAQADIQVKFYDTNKGEITNLYESALNNGAEYVVGPLTKSQVSTIAAVNHPVPTLLLNDADISVQDNSYFFGLSPADEAVQVAIKARSKGYSRALIIAPQNDWGSDVTKAFANQWQKEGGYVVDTFSYTASDDLNKKMRNFLHITDSEKRENQLKSVLGQNIQIASSRRQDFDVIFLLAYPTKARQIMPLLNYYYAGNVPVYATSSVYSGSANALKDKDLNGVIFCDIPWVFSHQMGTKSWPEQFNSYTRLYALGFDSYVLITQLNRLILFPADGSSKGNGFLYLKPSRHIARILEWGQFKQGLVHLSG